MQKQTVHNVHKLVNQLNWRQMVFFQESITLFCLSTYNGIIYIGDPYFVEEIQPSFIQWIQTFALGFFQHHFPTITFLFKISWFCVPNKG